jgi:hypothetical protein
VAELGAVVAEAAEGVAEGALEVAAASRAFTGRDARFLLIGAVVGGALAGFVTYRQTRKRLEKHYEEVAEEEITQMRDHFRKRLVVREEKPDLAAGGLTEKTEELGYASPTGPRPAPPEADPTAIEPRPPVPVPPRAPGPNKIHEALERAQDLGEVTEDDLISDAQRWIDAEKLQRNHRIPYVIHVDERGEADFDTVTYTYYEGDDVVCDTSNQIIQPVDEIVGNHNLGRFGQGGTDDPNVVYVRNDHLALEIELVRDPGSYTEEVRGIQHSDGGTERIRRRPQEDR